MNLKPIEKVGAIDPKEFRREFLQKGIPVVLTDLAKDWPAVEKWNWDFLRTHYGHLEVPIYGNDFHKAGKGYMGAAKKMKFGDYLHLIETEPTEYRMFLYNIFEHAPELTKDFITPTIMKGFLDKYPFMFFGGKGSYVALHYDIDCSSVFHTHFMTEKQCILFDKNQSKLLYNHPFTVQSHVDVLNPDYDKFPALRKVEGYETTLKHGETLFMPPLCWHFMHYIEGGYSLSLRANVSTYMKVKGLLNIGRHLVIDKGMNKVFGQKWKEYKVKTANKRAAQAMLEF